MVEITEDQYMFLVRFLDGRIPDILSDIEDFGILEPLLPLNVLTPPPKDFDAARAKLKEIRELAYAELTGWRTTIPIGDYSCQKLIMHQCQKPDDIYFNILAEKTDSGFSAALRAHLRGNYIPGADDVLGVTGGEYDSFYDNGQIYPIADIIYEKDVRELDAKRVLRAIQAYVVAANALRRTEEITIERKI